MLSELLAGEEISAVVFRNDFVENLSELKKVNRGGKDQSRR